LFFSGAITAQQHYNPRPDERVERYFMNKGAMSTCKEKKNNKAKYPGVDGESDLERGE